MTSDLRDLYQETILDHSRRPRNHHELPGARSAEGYNPLCGDEIEMQLDFDGDTLADLSIRGRGCSISQASASMMSDLVQGKSVAEIRDLTDEFKQMMTEPDAPAPEALGDLEALQGVAKFAVRVKCATLAWHTLNEGIDQHEKGDGAVRIEEL